MPDPVPATMHALRLHRPADASQRAEVRWEEVATPQPSGTEVLVRVDACAVDADDLAIVAGARSTAEVPVTLGRAAAGVVVATGPQAPDWQPGDPVVVDGGVSCGRCRYCTTARDNLCVARRTLGRDQDGAHAGFVLSDARHLLPASGDLPAATLAVAARTVAVVYHALKRAGVGEGVTLGVHGLGARGLHAVLLARLAGAHVIAVGRGERTEQALAWGADEAVADEAGGLGARVREVTEGGLDCALELTGEPGHVAAAVEGLRAGGRVALTRAAGGLPPAALRRAIDRELDVVGTHDATLQDLGEVIDLLADGRLDLSRSVAQEVATADLPDRLEELARASGDPDSLVAVPR